MSRSGRHSGWNLALRRVWWRSVRLLDDWLVIVQRWVNRIAPSGVLRPPGVSVSAFWSVRLQRWRVDAGVSSVSGESHTVRCHRDRYRAMAAKLGFESHMKRAEEMA